jgi:hypothetical protein
LVPHISKTNLRVSGGFALDCLRDVTWSLEPFDRLVLDSRHKELIHALVEQHASRVSTFDDFVRGKGKGLVGLLAGPPGCGKTLTAEAAAEVFLVVSCDFIYPHLRLGDKASIVLYFGRRIGVQL